MIGQSYDLAERRNARLCLRITLGEAHQHADPSRPAGLLRARCERAHRRTTKQRYDGVSLPDASCARIAHLGTADCCIHPPGRNEMIAITPPIIFSKEVAQKQATPFPRQDLTSLPKIVSDQISGDGVWMKI